jgi:transaldolase
VKANSFYNLITIGFVDSDFLANGGAALRVAIETDEETARKMKDALLLFGECEDKARAYVRSLVD